MNLKKRRVMGGFNRFRLMLTLGLAVLLPAAALIYVNFSQLRTFERDKVLEAAIHRDFQDRLALTEKRINKKAFTLVEEARDKKFNRIIWQVLDWNEPAINFYKKYNADFDAGWLNCSIYV